ncbi:uncharacterized protein IL334_006815 [Kwoniella shivajii]|uniref:Uncharacterized protein n=1 Tax=Kwoniella shivajii TaxID=564305 RepID=A0ABZ1D8P7_9TREE|nr:hypothetical protein IL334_006815 [Kwoniella shivajii]
MRLGTFLLGLVCLLGGLVSADTEIVNFHLPLRGLSQAETSKGTLANAEVTTLYPSNPLLFNLSSSDPEKHFQLNLNGNGHKSWTIRASYPGSSPVKLKMIEPNSKFQFSITGQALSPRMNHSFLQQYIVKYLPTDTDPTKVDRLEDFDTVISIVLEPLILGIIPQTALPTIAIVLVFVLGAGTILPYVIISIEKGLAWSDVNAQSRKIE